MNAHKKIKLNLLNKTFFLFNIFYILFVYSIYLNKYISPYQFVYFNYVAIGFPVLVSINLIFLFYWLIINWRYFIILGILSICMYTPLSKSYQYFGKKETATPDFKVMTYNVRYLRGDGTYKIFENLNADVILLQEVYLSQLNTLMETTLKDYYHEQYELISFFSKYPIIETKPIYEGASHKEAGHSAYIDIDRGIDTVRIINVYMEPMYIDKSLVKDAIEANTADVIEAQTKKINNLLSTGIRIHEKQLNAILPYIKNSKYPVILGGDLNTTPGTHVYEKISSLINDAYYSVGKENGTTFHGFKFPIRIDYLFNSHEITPVSTQIIREKHSDHYPIIGQFKLP